MRCELILADLALLPEVLQQINAVFNLNANLLPIYQTLGADAVLAEQINQRPGLRVPAAWDGFEIAIRAIVGQQVSVVGATTVMGRLVQNYAQPLPQTRWGLTHSFPSPQALSDVDVNKLSMPKARANTIKSLATEVAAGRIDFSTRQDNAELHAKLLKIKGIGEWTASYIAMRALADANAFLQADLVLLKNARRLWQRDDSFTAKHLLQLAESWQPYRAYAGMHIWNA